MHKNKQESGIFYLYSRTKKSKYYCHPPFHPPIFCRHSLKLLSPTLPKLMNWILLSPPTLSSDPDTPQNLERAHRQAEQPQRNHATTRTSNKVNRDPVNKARLILTSEYFFYLLKKNVGEYFGRCERCGGTQNIAGDPCFFLNRRGTRKYRGGLKKSRGGRPGGTSRGDFHWVSSRGCYYLLNLVAMDLKSCEICVYRFFFLTNCTHPWTITQEKSLTMCFCKR